MKMPGNRSSDPGPGRARVLGLETQEHASPAKPLQVPRYDAILRISLRTNGPDLRQLDDSHIEPEGFSTCQTIPSNIKITNLHKFVKSTQNLQIKFN